jgi:hypothetical protein
MASYKTFPFKKPYMQNRLKLKYYYAKHNNVLLYKSKIYKKFIFYVTVKNYLLNV